MLIRKKKKNEKSISLSLFRSFVDVVIVLVLRSTLKHIDFCYSYKLEMAHGMPGKMMITFKRIWLSGKYDNHKPFRFFNVQRQAFIGRECAKRWVRAAATRQEPALARSAGAADRTIVAHIIEENLNDWPKSHSNFVILTIKYFFFRFRSACPVLGCLGVESVLSFTPHSHWFCSSQWMRLIFGPVPIDILTMSDAFTLWKLSSVVVSQSTELLCVGCC